MNEYDDLVEALKVGEGLNPEDLAEEIIAAGWHRHRTITTAEELDKLPDGSIIRSADGLPFQKDDGAWVQLTGDDISMSMLIPGKTLAHHAGPFTVLHEGARDE